LDLLVHWEELRRQGKTATPEELCPDDTRLQALLRERLARRQRLHAALDLPDVARHEEVARPASLPVIDGYEMGELLGRGGMGLVFKAVQKALKRPVALKIVLSGAHAGAEERARFRTEAEAVARLHDPGIVQIYEVGEQAGCPFLALEFVSGGSLAQQLDGTPMPPRRAAQLLLDLARAVQHAHEQGIIHRDLKPANVLLTESGVAKIADFGLAKVLDAEQGQTRTGAVLGSPSYMAPEQAEGKARAIGAATDVYALGAILYELLAGRPPFKAETAMETLLQVQFTDPVSPSRLQPKLPRDLVTICLHCLRKEPRQRYASALALAEDLSCFLEGRPIRARPVGRAERVLRWCRRKPMLAGLSAAVVLLVGVVAIGGPLAAFRIAGQRDQLRAELWQSSLQEAQAERKSGQVGQRFESLKALSRAAAIRPSLELRNEAITCLALPDLRLVRQWTGLPLFVVGFAFDAQFRRYAQNEGDTIAVRQVADERLLFSLPSPGAGRLVFSNDGRFLAAEYGASKRGSCCLVWEMDRGQNILDVPCHGAIGFSPDSRRLAVRQPKDAGLVIFDLESGKEIRRWAKCPPSHHLVFHPKEPLLAISTGPERTVEILAEDTGEVVATLSHPREVGGIAWGDDGRLLAAGMEGGPIYLWDVASRRRRAVLEGHTSAPIFLFFIPPGDVLVSTSDDDTTRLWDVVRGRQLLAAPGFAMGFRGDGGQLALRLGDQVRVWEVILTGACRTLVHGPGSPSQLTQDYGGPWDMAYHPRGHLLASAGDDGVHLWDPATGKERSHLPVSPAETVLFHPNGTRLISYGEGGLRCWTLRSDPGAPDDGLPLGPPRLLEGPTNPYRHRRACCWCPGERSLAVVANEDERLVVVQPFEGPGEPVAFKGRRAECNSVAESPDGRWLAAGVWSDDGIKVWELATGKWVKDLPGSRQHRTRTTVLFSPDGKWLVAGGQVEYRFWRVGSWETGLVIPRSHLENRYGRMAFTRDGKVLAIAWLRDLVRLVDVSNGKELATLTSPDPKPITKICFSPDEKQLAVATDNYVIHLWDLQGLRAQLAELGLDWDSPP
jgi:WD40 repeat protein